MHKPGEWLASGFFIPGILGFSVPRSPTVPTHLLAPCCRSCTPSLLYHHKIISFLLLLLTKKVRSLIFHLKIRKIIKRGERMSALTRYGPGNLWMPTDPQEPCMPSGCPGFGISNIRHQMDGSSRAVHCWLDSQAGRDQSVIFNNRSNAGCLGQ